MKTVSRMGSILKYRFRRPRLVSALIDARAAKRRIVKEGFANILIRLLMMDVLAKLLLCGSKFSLWSCPNGHREMHRQGCGESLCWNCRARRVLCLYQNIVDDMSQIYESFGGLMQASQFVFTMPKDVWLRISEPDLGWLRSLAVRLVEQELGGVMIASADGKHVKRSRVKVAGIASYHTFHSFHSWERGNVWKGFFPHFNVLVFDRQFDALAPWYDIDGTRHEGAFSHRRVGLSQLEVNGIRVRLAKRWQEAVERKFGKSSFRPVGYGSKGFESSWDINYSYGATNADVERMIAYNIRPSLYDVFMEATEGAVPTDDELVWVRRLLISPLKGAKSFVSFGWLADCVKKEYLAKLSLYLPSREVRDTIQKRRYCVVCGEELKRISGEWTLDDAVRLDVPVRTFRPEGGGSSFVNFAGVLR